MAVDVVVEEVADNLEELAQVTRRINARSIGLVLGGLAVGAAAGFYFGYRWNKEKIKAEAYAASEKEVAKIREAYQAKAVAATPKPSLDEAIKDAGYSSATEPNRLLKAPVPGIVEPPPVSAPPVVTYDGGKDKNQNWNYPLELQNRTPLEPYVIHQDEFNENQGEYSHVTYTYYAGDNVLVDEDEKPLIDGDLIVGPDNLKFGHGTDDIDVVFVRNDKLLLEMEICRHSGSYEEEVMGLDGDEPT